MSSPSPNVVVIGGPNGAGKSTAAPAILRDTIAVSEFVNADVIARGLSGFHPEGAAIAAGRVLLQRIEELAVQRADFAFETTLASRMFAPFLQRLAREGYVVHVVFIWLPSPEMALERVQERMNQGGHGVPHAAVVRRFSRGTRNFLELYRPLAKTWRVYDNSSPGGPWLVAKGFPGSTEIVLDGSKWQQIQQSWREYTPSSDDPGDPL